MNPRPEWMVQTRTNLLRHIELTSEQPAHRMVTLAHLWSALSLIMPQRTVYAVVRPTVIFVLCFIVGTGGWVTAVSASLRSLPGDTLYPIKLATEQTQASVVGVLQGRAAATELRVSFASRRAQEVHKVLSSRGDEPQKKERIDAAVAQLHTELNQVREELKQVHKDATPDEAFATAQTVARAVNEIKLTFAMSGVQASTAAHAQETVSAIEELKSEAGRVEQEMAIVTSTNNGVSATVATTTIVLVPVVPTTPTSTTAPVASTTVLIIVPRQKIQPPPLRVEKPLELSPDVTDQKTEVTIEAWE